MTKLTTSVTASESQQNKTQKYRISSNSKNNAYSVNGMGMCSHQEVQTVHPLCGILLLGHCNMCHFVDTRIIPKDWAIEHEGSCGHSPFSSFANQTVHGVRGDSLTQKGNGNAYKLKWTVDAPRCGVTCIVDQLVDSILGAISRFPSSPSIVPPLNLRE